MKYSTFFSNDEFKKPNLYEVCDEFEGIKIITSLIKEKLADNNILVICNNLKVSNYVKAYLLKYKIFINDHNSHTLKHTQLINFFFLNLEFIAHPSFKKFIGIIKHPLFKFTQDENFDMQYLNNFNVTIKEFISSLPKNNTIEKYYGSIVSLSNFSDIKNISKVIKSFCSLNNIDKKILFQFDKFINEIEVNSLTINSAIQNKNYLKQLKQVANDYKILLNEKSKVVFKTFDSIDTQNYDLAILFDFEINDFLNKQNPELNLNNENCLFRLMKLNFHIIFSNSFEDRVQIKSPIFSILKIEHGLIKLNNNPQKFEFLKDVIEPRKRPQIKIAQSCKPLTYSISSIEKLIRDPYSFYLQYILKLKEKDYSLKISNEKEFGIFIHQLMHELKVDKSNPIDNLDKFFEQRSEEYFAENNIDNYLKIIWLKKLSFIIHVLKQKYAKNIPDSCWTEIDGKIHLKINDNIIALKAKADCIEKYESNYFIIDYKTGSVPQNINIKNGLFPQLAIEKLILENEGFNLNHEINSVVQNRSVETCYVQLNGKRNNEKVINVVKTENIQQNLIYLINKFLSENSVYFANHHIDESRKTKAYDHLRRRQEWFGYS